jgi:hypothetical protein
MTSKKYALNQGTRRARAVRRGGHLDAVEEPMALGLLSCLQQTPANATGACFKFPGEFP